MNRNITVIALGPGDPALLTRQAEQALRSEGARVLRTGRHPISEWLTAEGLSFSTLDGLYETEEDFDQMYLHMAETLWRLAEQSPVLYGVPDPLSDASVDSLRALRSAKDTLRVLPGVSHAACCLSGNHPVALSGGYRLSPAAALSAYDPEIPLLITEIDSPLLAGEIKERLMGLLPDEATVYFFADGAAPRAIPLLELDRQKRYDHLTALLAPAFPAEKRQRYTLRDLEAIMERLRAPDGCPWDSVQTHASLRPYVVEEAWETVAAIDEEDPDHLSEELGDLLFQVVFHASISRACGEFDMGDVITSICRKMIRRHPHVFGTAHFDSAEAVARDWESIKRAETESRTVAESLEDVSTGLPALKYAIKVVKKAYQLPELRRTPMAVMEDILALVGALLDGEEKLQEEPLGQLMLRLCELCYCCGTDGEILLHETVDRFKQRFAASHSDQ